MGGLLAAITLPAAALEIWQIDVASTRGEPLRASVALQTAAGEQIGPECLSLGDERDAPDPELPLIRDAIFSLSPTGDSIQFTTSAAITAPAVAVVLRVQCPGSPLYARLLNLHLRPAGVARPVPLSEPAKEVQSFAGATLKIKRGDTLYGIARTIFPQNGETVQDLVKAIVLVNPALFPEQRSRPLRIGEELLIPDLRTVQQILKRPPPKPATRMATSSAVRDIRDAISAPTQPLPEKAAPVKAEAPSPSKAPDSPATSKQPKPAKGLQLKIAADVDLSRVGANEARRAELRRIFAGDTPRRVVVAAPREANDALELKAAQLRESQDLIDKQIGMLEQAVSALSRAVIAAAQKTPPAPAQPAPAPRPVQPQVVVRHEFPLWLWPGVAAIALFAAGLAFLFGRRSASNRKFDENEVRIDRLLEEARAAAGPLLSSSNSVEFERAPQEQSAPKIDRAVEKKTKPKPPALAPAAPTAPKPRQESDADAPTPLPEIDAAVETQPKAVSGVDFVLDAGVKAGEESPTESAVSTNLRQEMALALDNTRSMFTDVDRFIALGRTENAISLLEFQVQKDEKDRDSWVKLLAVYRQEEMTAEFEKAHRTFKRLFPGDDV